MENYVNIKLKRYFPPLNFLTKRTDWLTSKKTTPQLLQTPDSSFMQFRIKLENLKIFLTSSLTQPLSNSPVSCPAQGGCIRTTLWSLTQDASHWRGAAAGLPGCSTCPVWADVALPKAAACPPVGREEGSCMAGLDVCSWKIRAVWEPAEQNRGAAKGCSCWRAAQSWEEVYKATTGQWSCS